MCRTAGTARRSRRFPKPNRGFLANVFVSIVEAAKKNVADLGRVHISENAQTEDSPIAHVWVGIRGEFYQASDRFAVVWKTTERKGDGKPDFGVRMILVAKDRGNRFATTEVP